MGGPAGGHLDLRQRAAGAVGEIRDQTAARPPAGFGSVRVAVTVGTSTWRTSVFPGGDGRYDLPVKKAVRRREGVEAGDRVRVRLEVLDGGPEP